MRRSRAKIRWKQPLLTLAALTLLLAFDGSGILRVGLGCAVLHECGHALAYCLLWQRWPEIEVSPFGLCLRLRGLPMTNLQELLLAAAGPAVNLRGSAGLHARHGLYLWWLLVRLLQSAGGRQQSAAPARPGRCAYCRVSVAFWPEIGYNKRTH